LETKQNTKKYIKPFNDFFINCYTNAMLTFVLDKAPSYKLAANMNDYSYFLEDLEGKAFPFLFVDYTQQFYDNFSPAVIMEGHVFGEQKEISEVEELIERVLAGEKIIVYPDLYYWTVKIGRSYNMPVQIHMKHAITLVDYDKEKKSFLYFDMDNSFHFNAYQIEKQDMVDVIQSTKQYEIENQVKISDINYSVIRVRDTVKSYVFNYDMPVKNAKRLIGQLKEYQKRKVVLDELVEAVKVNTSLMVIKCTIYGNVQKGNIRLFQDLQNQKMLTDIQTDELCELENKLIYTNNLILTGILMCEAKGKWDKMCEHTQSRYELIDQEIQIWNKFLKYMGSKQM